VLASIKKFSLSALSRIEATFLLGDYWMCGKLTHTLSQQIQANNGCHRYHRLPLQFATNLRK